VELRKYAFSRQGGTMEQKDLGPTSIGMPANQAALLSYAFGVITGIIFFVLEKQNKFVRFHAMQSIVVFGALTVATMVLMIIPILGWLIALVLYIVEFILWIVLMLKAYQGEYFKLPIAGDIAEKNS